jgi:glycosyltransferase involved in cell wall biosynthesis
MDGGGRRVRAFLNALEDARCDVNVVGVGPKGVEGVEMVVSSPVHRLKRRLLPIALRGPVEAELSLLSGCGPTMSLIPSANRWSLRDGPTWLDFPDRWSAIARNHARTVDRMSAVFNLTQARLWSRREAIEYCRADVVSAASWSDRIALGRKAVWLPTPVVHAGDLVKPRLVPSSDERLTYGMLANFDYPPNKEAYHRLVGEWLPALLPTARRVVVAGFGSEQLPRVPDVDIIGTIDEVEEFYDRVDVVVAPIERGGGMKVKVVEAMVHGVPVLATEHATEGLPEAIADECIRWGYLPSGRRDPRDDPKVMRALHSFTFESFQNEFRAQWLQRMANHG